MATERHIAEDIGRHSNGELLDLKILTAATKKNTSLLTFQKNRTAFIFRNEE
jgi:hypothetical protein